MGPVPTLLVAWTRIVQRPLRSRLSWMWTEFGPFFSCLTNSTNEASFSNRGLMSHRTFALVETVKRTSVPGCWQLLVRLAQNRFGTARRLVTFGTSVAAGLTAA